MCDPVPPDFATSEPAKAAATTTEHIATLQGMLGETTMDHFRWLKVAKSRNTRPDMAQRHDEAATEARKRMKALEAAIEALHKQGK